MKELAGLFQMANSTLSQSSINTTRASSSDGAPVQLAYFIVLAPAIFANLLAIVIFGRSFRKSFPVLNLFLFSLSCVDLLGCFYGVHATVTPLYEEKLTPALCHVVSFVGAFCGLLSSLFAALLAVDRYYALCRPYDYERVFDRRRAYIYITIVVILATFISLLNVVGLGVAYLYVEISPGVNTLICSSRVYQHEPHRRVFGYVYGVIGSCILLVVIVCNIKVIIAVLKMRRRVLNIGTIEQPNNRPKSPMTNAMQVEVKFARVIGALSVVLLICWAPFMMNALLSQTDVILDRSYLITSNLLVTMNFIIDPFVFLVLRKAYRQEAKELFRSLCRRQTHVQRHIEAPPTGETSASQSKANKDDSV